MLSEDLVFFRADKRGVELSINTMIIIILAIVALIVILFIFSSAARQFAASVFTNLKIALGMLNETHLSNVSVNP